MDFDVTFLMQFGILMVLMLMLEKILHQPLLYVLAAREQATSGTLGEARALEKLTAVDRHALEERVSQGRHRAQAERERLRQAGREQARRIEAAARQHMLHARQTSRAEAQALEQRIAQSLAGAQAAWRQQLVDLALGRKKAS